MPSRTSAMSPGASLGWLPYVLPFALYGLFLIAKPYLPFTPDIEYLIRIVVVGAAIAFVSTRVFQFKPLHWGPSIGLGIVIFAVWVGPDLLFPGYRDSILFTNSLLGKPESTLPLELRTDIWFLVIRCIGTALIVPIAEELFWRGWLIRVLVDRNFESVPIGKVDRFAFWTVALLFASEHGSYWDVGLIAGILFNVWLVRTRCLSDCIVAHAVANALLAAYVIQRGQWQFWL